MLAVIVVVTLWLFQISLLNFFQPILDGGIIQVDISPEALGLPLQTVLNAVKWCGKAWDEVSESTIKKCFHIVVLSGVELKLVM